MTISTETKIRLGYGSAFLVLLIAFSYSVITAGQLLDHIHWVGESNSVLHHLEGLMLEVQGMDASLQEGKQMLHVQEHFNAIDSICTLMKSAAQGNVLFTRHLLEVGKNLHELQDEVIPKIDRPGKTGKQATVQAKALLKNTTEEITEMHAAEKALLEVRKARLDNSSGSMKGINIVILGIVLLLAGYSWISYYNENIARKRAGNQMMGYSSELEKKITELVDANKELVQLRSLQKFTSTGRIARVIAHEIRNPLTNINLAYDQLKDMLRHQDHVILLLDTIIRNNDRIAQLINELLNATGVQELTFKAVSINDVLEEALEIARDRINLENIRVKKVYGPHIPPMYLDADKIKIAFINIILNAIEAMAFGVGILTVQTQAKDHTCIITISDNGTGMDQDTADKIFDPYYTSKSNGNGLGLTNTQNIILNHKGTIDVESKIGEGTIFTIVLNISRIDGDIPGCLS